MDKRTGLGKQPHVYRQFPLFDGTTVTLRTVQANDLDKLLFFINILVKEKRDDKESQLFTGFEERVSRKMEADYLYQTLASIKHGETISVAAEIEDKIVGNGEVTREHYLETRHYGRLGLAILPQFRGRGIGREMVRTLVKESRTRGLKTIYVEFLSTNTAALHTYEKAGFEKSGRFPGKVSRQGKFLDSIIMVRQL